MQYFGGLLSRAARIGKTGERKRDGESIGK
jgi:hypothetical protein